MLSSAAATAPVRPGGNVLRDVYILDLLAPGSRFFFFFFIPRTHRARNNNNIVSIAKQLIKSQYRRSFRCFIIV